VYGTHPSLHLHRLLLAGDVEFAGQAVQIEAAVAAYVPAKHGVQSIVVVVGSVTSDSPGMYVPAEQLKHGVFAEAEYVPAPQETHSALPIVYLNCPGVHALHVSASGPVCPALH